MRRVIHTTGISAIDAQHRQIDELITRYRLAQDRAAEEEYLTALLQAAKHYFQFLEHFFDVKFPGEFQRRREEILSRLADMIRQRTKGQVDQAALAEELHRLFLLNSSVREG